MYNALNTKCTATIVTFLKESLHHFSARMLLWSGFLSGAIGTFVCTTKYTRMSRLNCASRKYSRFRIDCTIIPQIIIHYSLYYTGVMLCPYKKQRGFAYVKSRL